MKRLKIFAPLLLIIFALAACGGSSDASPATKISTPTTAPAPMTADQILQALKASGLPIGASFTYTADNDENHLLGRPGQYIGKANFIDTRLTATNTGADISVSDGGSIETFASLADANKRFAYLQSLSTSGSAMFAEYEYQQGTAVLRVSSTLTPDQAKAYSDALKKIVG